MSPEPVHFSAYQAAFAARIRAPKGAPLPLGAPGKRMRVYEELLFNNLEGFLLACFPITRELLGAREWKQTVRRFFREHRCHSPLFRDIPGAFLEWLGPRTEALFPALPFLAEFMHYEWLELSVSVAPEEPDPAAIEPNGDLLLGSPALRPGARLARYRYPVHRIGPRCKPGGPDGQAWCYLLHRDEDDVVRFTALNAVSARLVEMTMRTRPTGWEALTRIATESHHPHPAAFVEAGHQLLRDLRQSGAIMGTWR